MNDFLSKEDLESLLYKIRNTLCSYDYASLDNVIFFNNDVVYEYLCGINLIGERKTVGEAMEEIGAFIPVSLNETSLNFIMQSASFPELIDDLESDFSRKNKMEFLQIITNISGVDEWRNLLNLCETIRTFRVREEELVLL